MNARNDARSLLIAGVAAVALILIYAVLKGS